MDSSGNVHGTRHDDCCACCKGCCDEADACHCGGGNCSGVDCAGCGPCDCDCGDCSGGGGDCGGDAAGVVLVVIAVLVVFFAVLGVLYGFILVSFLLQRIIQRHYHVLQRKVLAKDYVVQDLDGVDLGRYRAARAAGRPCPPPPGVPDDVPLANVAPPAQAMAAGERGSLVKGAAVPSAREQFQQYRAATPSAPPLPPAYDKAELIYLNVV